MTKVGLVLIYLRGVVGLATLLFFL